MLKCIHETNKQILAAITLPLIKKAVMWGSIISIGMMIILGELYVLHWLTTVYFGIHNELIEFLIVFVFAFVIIGQVWYAVAVQQNCKKRSWK